jgi:hypothetical protein
MVHTPDIRALESEQSHLLMALDRVLAQEEQKESAARMARWLSLRGLVERAWSRVPGYRAHWQGYGFHPGMLQSWTAPPRRRPWTRAHRGLPARLCAFGGKPLPCGP